MLNVNLAEMHVRKHWRDERMSLLDDILDDGMIQDAIGIFDNNDVESTRCALREEWLSMDDDEMSIFSQKGMGMKP